MARWDQMCVCAEWYILWIMINWCVHGIWLLLLLFIRLHLSTLKAWRLMNTKQIKRCRKYSYLTHQDFLLIRNSLFFSPISGSTIIMIMVIYSIEFRSCIQFTRGEREREVREKWMTFQTISFSSRFNSIKSLLISIKSNTWSGFQTMDRSIIFICMFAHLLLFLPHRSISVVYSFGGWMDIVVEMEVTMA